MSLKCKNPISLSEFDRFIYLSPRRPPRLSALPGASLAPRPARSERDRDRRGVSCVCMWAGHDELHHVRVPRPPSPVHTRESTQTGLERRGGRGGRDIQ